jgi:uncharacterized protein YjdB
MSVRSATSLLLVLALALPGCADSPNDPLNQVTAVHVTPATAAVTALGRMVPFTARPVDAGGTVVGGIRVAWTSSTPAVATVDSTGLVTAVGPGEATISARAGTVSGSAVITVTQAPATVEVGPAADTIRAIGASITLTAIVRDSGAAGINGAPVAWSSSDSTVVRVSAAGVATAVREGASVITATSSGLSSSRTLVVHQVVRSVTLTPAADTARHFGQVLTYIATARDSLNVVVDGRAVAWSSADTTVAKVDALGRATARANGTTSISATVDGQAGAATLLVDVRGAIRIAVDVSGGGDDADGFMVHVGDSAHRIGNQPIIVRDLVPGGHPVSLSDVAGHCHGLLDRANLDVIAGDTLNIALHVRCRGDYAYELWTGSPLDYELRFVDRHGTDVLIASHVPRTSWSWSPDGSRIAWSARGDDGNADIFVANPDGTGRVRLTNHPSDDLDPSWSPDGRFIAFRSGDSTLVRIMVVRSDGTDSREIAQVAHASTSVTGPAWSPRGDAIAYSRISADRYSTDLWLVAPDGTNNRKLETTGRWNWQPAWSPDGTWLAYEGTEESGWTLRVVRPDGTGERRLAQSGQGGLMPRWSPDGSSFVFVKHQTTYRAATIRFDGTGEKVHEHYHWSMYPSWTSDGRHVLMMAVASNLSQLAIMDPDGANVQLIPGTSGAARPVARPR